MPLEQHPDVRRLAQARPSPAARVIGHLSDPVLLVPTVLLVVSVRAQGDLLVGVGWAALSALFCIGLPYALLVHLVRRGALNDRHVVVRQQRKAPLAAAAASVALGALALHALGAPRELVALVTAMLAGLLTITVISLTYKASLHVAVTSGTLTILTLTLGTPWGWLLLPVAALVAWARIRSGRHTLGQAVVGFVVGCTAAAVAFPAAAG